MRGTRLRLVIGLVAVFALGLVAAGCGSDDSSDSSDTSTEASSGSADVQTINDGTLLIGTDAPYPPFEIGTPRTPTSAASTSTSATTSPRSSG